ncbi:hypothetical protein J3R82DRAFT_7434 [Butyriboletus roseoflavus]|nr:hypothetical protein J3R82DRAFT_7434 [Butyriboletus roseoflavus]
MGRGRRRRESERWRIHGGHHRATICVQGDPESPRFYKASDVEGSLDYEVAQKRYKTQFECVFTHVETESPGLVTHREFAAFYNVLRGFDEDVLRIAGTIFLRLSGIATSPCTFLNPRFSPFFPAVLRAPHGVSRCLWKPQIPRTRFENSYPKVTAWSFLLNLLFHSSSVKSFRINMSMIAPECSSRRPHLLAPDNFSYDLPRRRSFLWRRFMWTPTWLRLDTS